MFENQLKFEQNCHFLQFYAFSLKYLFIAFIILQKWISIYQAFYYRRHFGSRHFDTVDMRIDILALPVPETKEGGKF